MNTNTNIKDMFVPTTNAYAEKAFFNLPVYNAETNSYSIVCKFATEWAATDFSDFRVNTGIFTKEGKMKTPLLADYLTWYASHVDSWTKEKATARWTPVYNLFNQEFTARSKAYAAKVYEVNYIQPKLDKAAKTTAKEEARLIAEYRSAIEGFAQVTGLGYDQAKKIVAKAVTEQKDWWLNHLTVYGVTLPEFPEVEIPEMVNLQVSDGNYIAEDGGIEWFDHKVYQEYTKSEKAAMQVRTVPCNWSISFGKAIVENIAIVTAMSYERLLGRDTIYDPTLGDYREYLTKAEGDLGTDYIQFTSEGYILDTTHQVTKVAYHEGYGDGDIINDTVDMGFTYLPLKEDLDGYSSGKRNTTSSEDGVSSAVCYSDGSSLSSEVEAPKVVIPEGLAPVKVATNEVTVPKTSKTKQFYNEKYVAQLYKELQTLASAPATAANLRKYKSLKNKLDVACAFVF